MASVLFDKGGDNRVEITKGGSYVYWGTPGDFYEWEFRTRLRAKAAGKDDEKYADMMGKIIEGLRGEAFVVAKELGLAARRSMEQPRRLYARRRRKLDKGHQAQRVPKCHA